MEARNRMGGIRCLRPRCPVCGIFGSCQVFLRKDGSISYARTRHYSHLDKDSHKPQFTYCKIEDLETLKTLLSQQGTTLSTDKTEGSLGQDFNLKVHDPENLNSSSVSKSTGAGSLARLGHLLDVQKVAGSSPVRPILNLFP
jgi:hypothetical protein